MTSMNQSSNAIDANANAANAIDGIARDIVATIVTPEPREHRAWAHCTCKSREAHTAANVRYTVRWNAWFDALAPGQRTAWRIVHGYER